MTIVETHAKDNGFCPNPDLFKDFFVGLYTVNKEEVFLACNDVFAKLIGFKNGDEAVGKSIKDLQYKEMFEFLTSNDGFVLKYGTTNEVNRIFTQFKTNPLVRLIKYPIKNNENVVVGIQGVVLNIPFSAKNHEKLLDDMEVLSSNYKKLSSESNSEKKEIAELKKSKNYLNNILDNIPGFVYWKDKSGVILGDNVLHAKTVGFSKPEEVIGKTDYDFSWRDQADKMRDNDLMVMKSGKMITAEEEGVLPDGHKIIGLTHKAPLIDEEKKVIGVVGISIDVTALKEAQKEAERLKSELQETQLKNELQKVQIEEHEKFRKIVDQVVHDIKSPISAMKQILKAHEADVPEEARVPLQQASTSILDVANSLLNRYGKYGYTDVSEAEVQQPIMVALILSQVLSGKKYQYKDMSIKFTYDFCKESTFTFIKVELPAFGRMMSNLINNAIESLDGEKGTVHLGLSIDANKIKITVQDNGKGMPQEIIDKIMNNVQVATNKKDGHGIGLTQIREALERNHGKLSIASKLGEGTKMILTFPMVKSPKWIAKNIKLNKGDTVIILDDDEAIHGAWDTRFEDHLKNNIQVKHFIVGDDTIKFINDFAEKDKIFLLTDFKLLKQKINGIDVVEKTKIKRAILVTSHDNDLAIHNLVIKNKIQLLPKQLALEIPIEICEVNKNCSLIYQDKNQRVYIVIIDDNELIINATVTFFEYKNKKADKYYKPESFLNNLSKYDKDTIMLIDHEFKGSKLNGFDVAKQLHEQGFTRLYLFSGRDFEKSEVPNYLTVILKTDIDALSKLAEG